MEENNEIKYYINEYITNRKYGGPEEGGWDFEVGTFVRCHAVVYSIIQAQMEVAALMGYLTNKQEELDSSDWPAIVIQTEPGENYPKETPHYE